jgi:hypothetical protein
MAGECTCQYSLPRIYVLGFEVHQKPRTPSVCGKKQEHTLQNTRVATPNPLFTFPMLAAPNLFVLVADLATDLCRVEYSLRE